MNRITKRFTEIKAAQRNGLVVFVTAGAPDIETTQATLPALVSAGADIIEIGMPFSDPLAEGPVIQKSSYVSLLNKTSVDDCLDLAKHLRESDDSTPLVLMGYYNPVYQYGLSKFLEKCNRYGVDGLIIVDLPAVEANEFKIMCNNNGVSFIPLIAPTSTDSNIELSLQKCDGFVYCVSVTGVTGARSEVSSRGLELVDRIKKFTDLPVAVGFGVSNKSHVDEICVKAEAAVVGSALVNVMLESDKPEIARNAGDFVKSLTNHSS